MMHAFWLLGPASAWIGTGDAAQKVTNEVDHEWNNRFLGEGQRFLYPSTGASRATLRGGRKAPMGAPEAPPPLGIHYDRESDGSVARAWTCRYAQGTRSRTLAPEACSALLQGRRVGGLPAPRGEVWTTLIQRVADDGIRFELSADLGGARLEMASQALTPPTQLPLFTLFSQHLYPGGGVPACEGLAEVPRSPRYAVDWFLYSPDETLACESAHALAAQIRSRGVSRLATVPGARLERPARPLVGHADRWGYGTWTTPLALSLPAPRRWPPARRPRSSRTRRNARAPSATHGPFGHTTTTAVTRPRPATIRSRLTTHSADARTVLVRVRLEELDDELRVVRNETVRPVERMFMIQRR